MIALVSFLMGMMSLLGFFCLFRRIDPYTFSDWLKQIHPVLQDEISVWKEQCLISSKVSKEVSDIGIDAIHCLAGIGLGFHYHGNTIRWKREANQLNELELDAPWRAFYFNELGSVLRHISANTLIHHLSNDISFQTPLYKWAEQKEYLHEHIQNLEQTLPGISTQSLVTLFRITFFLLYNFSETDFAEFLDRDLRLNLIPYSTIYPEPNTGSQAV